MLKTTLRIPNLVSKKPQKIKKPLYYLFQRLFVFPFVFFGFLSLTLLSSCSYAQSSSYDYPILPTEGIFPQISKDFMRIRIKSSIALSQKKLNALLITELSDIAWDEDEQLLYAVSDEGFLYHFKLIFDKNSASKMLKSMYAIYATRLKDDIGYPLQGKFSDSEGLSLINGNNGIKGDTQLIISFENKPRIARYSTTGKFIKKIKIPKKLRKRKTYRSKNKALESVTVHPQYGILTAAEYPVKMNDIKYQTLYAVSKKAKKKVWHFKASKAANSAITALEVLEDGSILILERAYQNPITPVIINLRRLRLDKCNDKQECETETLASFNGADGWLLDNFEGLTHLRGNEYLMVSDDNQNILQKTIFLHFEIKKRSK